MASKKSAFELLCLSSSDPRGLSYRLTLSSLSTLKKCQLVSELPRFNSANKPRVCAELPTTKPLAAAGWNCVITVIALPYQLSKYSVAAYSRIPPLYLPLSLGYYGW